MKSNWLIEGFPLLLKKVPESVQACNACANFKFLTITTITESDEISRVLLSETKERE